MTLDELFPSLNSDLMTQMRRDLLTEQAFVQERGVVYKDGRSLSIDPAADSCYRYRVRSKDCLKYLGPRMHVAVQALLDAEPYAPVFDRDIQEVPDNRLITGTAWLLAHGFSTNTQSHTSFREASLLGDIRIGDSEHAFMVPLEVNGRYEPVIKPKGVVWSVHIPIYRTGAVEQAERLVGFSQTEGPTPRQALQKFMPILVVLSRIIRNVYTKEDLEKWMKM